jgi:hypothetical protein
MVLYVIPAILHLMIYLELFLTKAQRSQSSQRNSKRLLFVIFTFDNPIRYLIRIFCLFPLCVLRDLCASVRNISEKFL